MLQLVRSQGSKRVGLKREVGFRMGAILKGLQRNIDVPGTIIEDFGINPATEGEAMMLMRLESSIHKAIEGAMISFVRGK